MNDDKILAVLEEMLDIQKANHELAKASVAQQKSAVGRLRWVFAALFAALIAFGYILHS